ncbi:hypothetical protein [Parerythrobacter aestuarii]|uniref:hypothetical protein n=1 Tax=Parerythrobacter aestuarii TaxID=3020909 RepID=UPI0024DE5FD8|nr:hypothetical protein [Parerythrobacter aestuarii]
MNLLRKWRLFRRLKNEAKNCPGGWVYEIDWDYGDDYVPPEAIVAGLEVGANGELTGIRKENPNYRAVIRPTRKPRDYMERCLKGASHLRQKWVVEIDPAFDDLFPDVPEEGQTGSWFVGRSGRFTGEFRPNPHYKGDLK